MSCWLSGVRLSVTVDKPQEIPVRAIEKAGWKDAAGEVQLRTDETTRQTRFVSDRAPARLFEVLRCLREVLFFRWSAESPVV